MSALAMMFVGVAVGLGGAVLAGGWLMRRRVCRWRRHVHAWRVRWLWATDALEYTCEECGAIEVIYPWQ